MSALATGLAPLRCPRCGGEEPAASTHYRGCRRCLARGVAVNLVCEIPLERARNALEHARATPERSLWRYHEALPVDLSHAVTLGEGGTPLLELPRLADRLGIAGLLVKNEAANPTWSHKDRLASVSVSAARQAGARVICAASTGNHGAALAAYAARGGLRCLVATLASVPETMKVLMEAYGALVVAVEHSEDRYKLLEDGIERYGWWPGSNLTVPPVGSDPYGTEGYKTIAYELAETLGPVQPDWLVVPVAYGDCLAGIARGYRELVALGVLERAPRLLGAEVFGALGQALDGGAPGPVETRPTAAFSIGGAWTTTQAVDALTESGGIARTASDEEILDSQVELASAEGLYFEAASCAALAALKAAISDGTVAPDHTAALLVTSSGLKDPSATAERLAPVPTIDPTPTALAAALPAITTDATAAADLFDEGASRV